MTATTGSGPAALCARSMDIMATGSLEDFERVFHPEAVNREAGGEPPATRLGGPAGFYAAAVYLHIAALGRTSSMPRTGHHPGSLWPWRPA